MKTTTDKNFTTPTSSNGEQIISARAKKPIDRTLPSILKL